MKVQIISNDNGSCTNSNLSIYKCYNTTHKLFEVKPFCLIDEDDFCECFTNADKVFEQMQKGKIIFDVNTDKLRDKAKIIY